LYCRLAADWLRIWREFGFGAIRVNSVTVHTTQKGLFPSVRAPLREAWGSCCGATEEESVTVHETLSLVIPCMGQKTKASFQPAQAMAGTEFEQDGKVE
jgi:hypothetical protein